MFKSCSQADLVLSKEGVVYLCIDVYTEEISGHTLKACVVYLLGMGGEMESFPSQNYGPGGKKIETLVYCDSPVVIQMYEC